MERKIMLTGDGSPTVAIPEMGVTYHSRHGALQESRHVFIEAGLHFMLQQVEGSLSILEMGFGTGLNALLTAAEAAAHGRSIHYTALEALPLSREEYSGLEFPDRETLATLHDAAWDAAVLINPHFTLYKLQTRLEDFRPSAFYDLVYFDAFAPSAQPQLWTTEIFEKLFACMQKGGVLVTYCSKGDVRRSMASAGFTVTKLTGPPGKREMVRALKKQ